MFNTGLNPFLILKIYFNIVLIFVKFCLFLAVLCKIEDSLTCEISKKAIWENRKSGVWGLRWVDFKRFII